MKTISRVTVIGVLLVAVGGAWLLWPPPSPLSEPDCTSVAGGKLPSKTDRDLQAIHPASRDLAAASDKELRARELERLKLRWLEFSSENDQMEERRALAEETVGSLLCSEELILLIRFLDEREIYNTLEVVADAAFKSERAAEARQLLLELSDKWAGYRQAWSFAAGRDTPPEDFDAFHAALALKEPGSAQEALLGRNQRLSSSDPEAAIRSTLEVLEGSLESSSRGLSLHNLMRKLPANVDFARMESLLPEVDPNLRLDPVNQGRVILFERWGNKDPAAAVNYLISSPDRLSPSLIEPIIAFVMPKDRAAGIEWIQELPAGPYRDLALGASLRSLFGYAEEARKIPPLISDPAIKEDALRTLRAIESGRY